MNEEQRITVCKTGLERIYEMLRRSPQDWRNFITLGRSVISHLDATTFMQQSSRTTEQAWMIAGLQRLAFSDPENGGVQDIAAWCSRQWLVIFQRDETNVAALRGIGQAWLWRAQPTLARIQRADSSSSSSGSQRSISQRSPPSRAAGTSAEQERQAAAAAREAERKAGTADYVEARGFLQPAAEYLDRAVAAASAQRVLSGDLLATVRIPSVDLVRRQPTNSITDSGSIHVTRQHVKPTRQRTALPTSAATTTGRITDRRLHIESLPPAVSTAPRHRNRSTYTTHSEALTSIGISMTTAGYSSRRQAVARRADNIVCTTAITWMAFGYLSKAQGRRLHHRVGYKDTRT